VNVPELVAVPADVVMAIFQSLRGRNGSGHLRAGVHNEARCVDTPRLTPPEGEDTDFIRGSPKLAVQNFRNLVSFLTFIDTSSSL
jgi:hypothetical protein